MVSHTRTLSIVAVLALGALTAFAGPQNTTKTSSSAAKNTKVAASKTAAVHVLQGSVVSISSDSMTVRSGKKDVTFKLDSATQKPASIAAGTEVSVNYRDDGNQHLATNIQPSAAKASGLSAKAPARK